MNDPQPRMSWRAPSWRTGAGIALAVIGLSCLAVFVVLGVLMEHSPRTAWVPRSGSLGGAVCLVTGLAMWCSVPRVEIDFANRRVRRGEEILADLTKTCAVLLRETLQTYVGTSGGKMEIRSWSVIAVQDPLDAEQISARFDASQSHDPSGTITLRHGAAKAVAEQVALPLAQRLGRPCFALDASGVLRAIG